MIKIPFLINLFTKNPFSPAKHPVDTPDLPCIRRSGEPSLWYSLLQSGPKPNLSLPTHAMRFRVSLSPAVPVARFAVPVVMGATEQDLCWLDFTFPQLSFRRQLAMISSFGRNLSHRTMVTAIYGVDQEGETQDNTHIGVPTCFSPVLGRYIRRSQRHRQTDNLTD